MCLQCQLYRPPIILRFKMSGRVRKYSMRSSKRSQAEITTPSTTTLPTPSHAFFDQNPEEQQPSPRTLEATKDHYRIDYAALIGPRVSQMQRYRMMKWLLHEANKRHYTREVFANTCYYLDLYLPKVQSFSVQNLQLIALGALSVASRIEGVKFPDVGGDFSKDRIYQIQEDIYLSLGFFLNPPTYVTVVDRYLECWEGFCSSKKMNGLSDSYLSKTSQAFQRARALFQKLEYVNMVASSLKHSYSQLVFNMFYLQNKINQECMDCTSLTLKELELYIQKAYLQEDSYTSLFQQFVHYCGFQEFYPPELDPSIGLYLAPFLRLPIEPSPPARMSINFQMYYRLQTTSPEVLKELQLLAKNLK